MHIGNGCSGRSYFAEGFDDETMPEDSRMVRIWLAGILVKRSNFWVVGHFTSMRSMTVVLPRPKWRRRSDWDMTLAPEWTSSIWAWVPVTTRTRAPMADLLHEVPTSLSLIQFCALPPSLRRREGVSPRFRITASMSPSLS